MASRGRQTRRGDPRCPSRACVRDSRGRIPERAQGEGVGRARDRPSPRRGARARYSAAEGSAMEGSLIVRLVSGAVLGRVPKRGLYSAVLFAKVVRTLSACEKYFFSPFFFLLLIGVI